MTEHWKEINGKIYFSPAVRFALKAVASETPVQRRRIHEWEELLKSFGVTVVTRRIVNAARRFCNHYRYRNREQFINTPSSLINRASTASHGSNQTTFNVSEPVNSNSQNMSTNHICQNFHPFSLQNENMMQNYSHNTYNHSIGYDPNYNYHTNPYSENLQTSVTQVQPIYSSTGSVIFTVPRQ